MSVRSHVPKSRGVIGRGLTSRGPVSLSAPSGGGGGVTQSSPSDFLQATDTGGHWLAAVPTTTVDNNGDQVSPGSSTGVYEVKEWTGIPNTTQPLTGGGTVRLDANRWLTYSAGSVGSGILVNALFSSAVDTSTGWLVMGEFRYSGIVTRNEVEAVTLDQHAPPVLRFKQSDGSFPEGGQRFIPWDPPDTGDYDPSEIYIHPGENDDRRHTWAMSFDGSSAVRCYVDGVFQREITPVNGTIPSSWIEPALTVGNRDGIDQDARQLFVRNRPAADDAEVQSLHDLFQADFYLVAQDSSEAGKGPSITKSFSILSNAAGSLTNTVQTAPSNGSVSINGSDYTYSANASFYGDDSFTYRAEAENGFTDAGAVSLTVVRDVVEDNFDEASSTALGSHTPDTDLTGAGWSVSVSGTATADGGVAEISSSSNEAIATVDPGVSTISAMSEFGWDTSGSAGQDCILAFRAADEQNFIQVRWNPGGQFSMAAFEGGTSTSLGFVEGQGTPGPGDTVWVSDDGFNIEAGINSGAAVISTSSQKLSGNTGVGFWTDTLSPRRIKYFDVVNSEDETLLTSW